MKLKKIILLMAWAAMIFISCQKKDEEKPAEDEGSESVDVYNEPSTVEFSQDFGYVLRVNSSFYTLESDTGSESDKTKWAASMPLGEFVSIGNIRRTTFAGDGKVYDFIEVMRDDGARGLAWDSQIAKAGQLAVVISEKANMYKTAKAVDVTGILLPRKTLVVFYRETERDGFVEIKCYDPVAQAYRQNTFIQLSSLSIRESDIQSSILLQTAEPLKNEGSEKNRKDALLETALFNYPDSVFYQEIEALAYFEQELEADEEEDLQ